MGYTPEEVQLSVVTPTLGRPAEVESLLRNLAGQRLLPTEVIVVDGAARGDDRTSRVVCAIAKDLPFGVHYQRAPRGTAVQRNVGIHAAIGAFVCLIDDDIRLEPTFLENIIREFQRDSSHVIGGISGYITNAFLNPFTSRRWRWYRKLHLFSTIEPGHFDYSSGYPINRYLQAPHSGLRRIDFMGAGCAVWRREVFDQGVYFDPFFSGHGVMEDAHHALRASQRGWLLYELGSARCSHLRVAVARESPFLTGQKSAVNYRYLFLDILPQRSVRQEVRWWLVQLTQWAAAVAALVRHPGLGSLESCVGKSVGIVKATLIRRGRREDNNPD
ncbi:MAG: glycosyltransferase family 2 protein [Acidimicrobiia bacterium]